MRKRICVVLLPDVLPLDFAIPMHVFAREMPEFYNVTTASVDGGLVQVAGGLQLVPDGGLELIRTADIVVVPGWANAAATRVDPVALDELRRAASRGAQLVSICSGAFALGQAGLLSGRRATTHWALLDQLAAQFPDVEVDRDAFYVDSGQVLTSGGVTSGVDLAIHMLRREVGAASAAIVARRIVAFPNRDGGQAQFALEAAAPPADDDLAAAQQWMLLHLGAAFTVQQAADQVHMSARSFYRMFKVRTGTSPLAWVHARRIERARELLEASSRTIDEITAEVGLGTAANLRAHFRRAVGVSPTTYRRRFRLGTAA